MNEISLNEIMKWTVYFHEQGVVVDLLKMKEMYKDIRRSNRSLRRDKTMSEDVKLYMFRLNKYRKSVLDNIVLNSEEFKRGNFLESVSFINSFEGCFLTVHPNYELTPTYRLVTKSPCISNMDNYLKGIIVSPDINSKLLSIDFKHQEPWIIVNLLDDDVLKDILVSNNDFYLGLLNYFNVEESDSNREIVKKVWNSSIYGSSRYSLGYLDLSWVSDIFHFINDNERVISLRDKVESNLKDGKCIYTVFGLNRSIPYDGKSSVRKAFNSIFQMSGAGLMYAGLKSIQSAVLDKTPPNSEDVRIYLTLHDEFVLQIPIHYDDDDIKQLMDSIELGVDGWTPARLTVKEGNNWGECE